MSMQAENPRAVAGGNLPPIKEFYEEQNKLLPEYLDAESADIIARVEELMAAAKRLPDIITTQEHANNYTQLIGFIGKCVKAAELKREELTAGPLDAQRIMMGHFVAKVYSKIGAPKTDKAGSWGGIKQTAQDLLTAWDREQARQERLRREEAERVAREAAELAAAAAAEEARRAAAARALEDALQREAEEKIRNEQDLARAVAMEQEIRDRAAARAVEEKAAQERAAEAAAEAARAAAAATAKASTMHSSVGVYGAKSGLRDSWKATVDRPKMTAATWALIVPFISADELQKAANAYAKMQKAVVTLDGITTYNDERSQVRG